MGLARYLCLVIVLRNEQRYDYAIVDCLALPAVSFSVKPYEGRHYTVSLTGKDHCTSTSTLSLCLLHYKRKRLPLYRGTLKLEHIVDEGQQH